jgi:hypothetical protein
MGLDIFFLGSHPDAEELNGARLAGVPSFFNFAHLLGMVFTHLEQADETPAKTYYKKCVKYEEKHPKAEEQFQRYSVFIKALDQFGDLGWKFPHDPDEYHPVARRLSAALMLRDEPVDSTEAGNILYFISFIRGWTSSALMFLPVDPDAAKSMLKILDTYISCLDVAYKNNLSFRIDF